MYSTLPILTNGAYLADFLCINSEAQSCAGETGGQGIVCGASQDDDVLQPVLRTAHTFIRWLVGKFICSLVWGERSRTGTGTSMSCVWYGGTFVTRGHETPFEHAFPHIAMLYYTVYHTVMYCTRYWYLYQHLLLYCHTWLGV